jgi:hypothetical protein
MGYCSRRSVQLLCVLLVELDRTLKEKTMRVVITDELQHQLEVYSTVTGKPVADVVEDGLRRWLVMDGTKDLQKAIAAKS